MKKFMFAVCVCGQIYHGIYIDCRQMYHGDNPKYILSRKQIGNQCKQYIEKQYQASVITDALWVFKMLNHCSQMIGGPLIIDGGTVFEKTKGCE